MVEEFQPLPTDWTRALAIVAHPDDIEFGAAGAVASWTAAGKDVRYLLLTRGEAGIDGMHPEEAASVREAEQRASAKIVGVTKVEFLNYVDGVIEYGLRLRRDLAAAIRRHQPELVLTYNYHDKWAHGKLNSADHRNTGRAVLDAVADAGNRWIFRDLEIEPWNGVKYIAVAGSPFATHAVDVSDTLDIGIASLEAHRAYLAGRGLLEVRGPLTGLAKQNGERFGGRPALTFELIMP